jgi:DnaK suppressor protein
VDAPDLDAVHAALVAERARLLEEIGETIVAPGQMTYGSQAAAASQVLAQQRDLALRDRSDHQLVLVDEALARLDAGTFGMCVRCGKPIGPERLEALPWAARCIDCQRLAARER